MSRGVSNKITYKPYNQGEQWLLSLSLDELVPQNHFVRIVSKTVDELEIEEVFARNTKGGGASRYNPVMLLKVMSALKNISLTEQKLKVPQINIPSYGKEKYEKANATFNDRNSYSKTDEDATFMRMKEDHMLNGQLKPGYNTQVGTENNFVIGYDVFPNPTDTRTFIPHLENVQKRLGCKFKFAIADAGYGSEENYDYLEKNEITGIVKYTTYEKETKRSFKKKTFNTENWKYDAEQKEYTCPCGNPVPYRKTVTKKNKSGYLQTYEVYQCENCEGCPFRQLCTKSEYGRVIQRNGHWLEQKAKVKNLLSSEEYKTLMKKRSTECETVFGQTKGNLGFRRFHLRGKEKVGIEWGLLMMTVKWHVHTIDFVNWMLFF